MLHVVTLGTKMYLLPS